MSPSAKVKGLPGSGSPALLRPHSLRLPTLSPACSPLPRTFGTCCSLYPEHAFPRYPQGRLPHVSQVTPTPEAFPDGCRRGAIPLGSPAVHVLFGHVFVLSPVCRVAPHSGWWQVRRWGSVVRSAHAAAGALSTGLGRGGPSVAGGARGLRPTASCLDPEAQLRFCACANAEPGGGASPRGWPASGRAKRPQSWPS